MKRQTRPNPWGAHAEQAGRALALASLLAPWLVAAARAQNGPGDLDPTFGQGGKVTTSVAGLSSGIADLALLPNGKILAVGFAGPDIALVRYNRDGSPDTSFGVGGEVTTDFFGEDDRAGGVVLQPDGKIVVAGSARGGVTGPDFAMARYHRDGSLDLSFGEGGKVTTDFFGGFDQANDVALLPSGKIVVVGEARGALGTNKIDFAVARYTRHGRLDRSFGDGGKVTTAFSAGDDAARAVVLRPGGKILVVGEANGNGPSTDFALVRYTHDGELDPTFGGDGKVTTVFPSGIARAHDVVVQPSGKVVVAGMTFHPGTSQDFALARYKGNGHLDPTFGTGGKVITDVAGDFDTGVALALHSRGKIVVAGGAYTDSGQDDFAVARYTADGHLDQSFGDGGRMITDFFGGSDAANGVAIQQNGRIVAGGMAPDGTAERSFFALARYLFHEEECGAPEMRLCLDEDVESGTGHSRWVTDLSGAAAHQDRDGGFCGARGYYYVAEETGRIRVEVNVADARAYRLSFRYRVGTEGQPDESLRVVVGGRSFDFHDGDLVNSDQWELSPPLAVVLGSGRQTIEFRSIGQDSVHLEKVSLEGVCPR